MTRLKACIFTLSAMLLAPPSFAMTDDEKRTDAMIQKELSLDATESEVNAFLDVHHFEHSTDKQTRIIYAKAFHEDYGITSSDVFIQFHFDAAGHRTGTDIKEIHTGP